MTLPQEAMTPSCFFCDRVLAWDTALITFFGRVLCPECNGDQT